MVENFKFVDVMSSGDVCKTKIVQLSKETQWCDHIYLPLPTSRYISKSLFVKIRLRYRFDRHQSHPSSIHQEVKCHFTIIIDLRLEVFSVLLKFILLDVIVENNPYSFMEILRYKLFCAVVRKYQPKKIEKWKFKMCLMFYLLLFYQFLNNPIWFVLYIRGIINYI